MAFSSWHLKERALVHSALSLMKINWFFGKLSEKGFLNSKLPYT